MIIINRIFLCCSTQVMIVIVDLMIPSGRHAIMVWDSDLYCSISIVLTIIEHFLSMAPAEVGRIESFV